MSCHDVSIKSLSASVTCVLEQSNSIFPLNREERNCSCLPQSSHLGLLSGGTLQLLVGWDKQHEWDLPEKQKGDAAAVPTCHWLSFAPSSLPHAQGITFSRHVPHCSIASSQGGGRCNTWFMVNLHLLLHGIEAHRLHSVLWGDCWVMNRLRKARQTAWL